MSARELQKVIWSEGLLVGPQLFQQTDRYHESNLDARIRPLVPFGWGVLSLAINSLVLEQSGVLRLDECRAIFPSGTVVSIPFTDAAPASRELPPQAFGAHNECVAVYLALPFDRPHARNYTLSVVADQRDQPRYLPEYVRLIDECSGENEQEIVLARKNLRLLFGDEQADGLERLKLAEVRRLRDGRLVLSQEYIPPCLTLGATTALQQQFDALTGLLAARSTAVLGVQQKRSTQRFEYRRSDPEILWLLGTLNGALALLSHYQQIGQVHPETAYRELLQLAGQLSIFSTALRATALSPYRHDDIYGSFQQLGEQLSALLALACGDSSYRVEWLPLQEATTPDGFPVLCSKTALEGAALSGKARLYLVIQAEAIEQQRQQMLLQQFPETATFTAYTAIDDYIKRAHGLRLSPTSAPHGALTGPEAAYYALHLEGDAWERLRAAPLPALYLPMQYRREFRILEALLLVVQGEE